MSSFLRSRQQQQQQLPLSSREQPSFAPTTSSSPSSRYHHHHHGHGASLFRRLIHRWKPQRRRVVLKMAVLSLFIYGVGQIWRNGSLVGDPSAPIILNSHNHTRSKQQPQKSRTTPTSGNSQSLFHFRQWERLRLSSSTFLHEEADDVDNFLMGKSCHWQESSLIGKLLSFLLFFSRASYGGEWVCRDCGGTDDGGDDTSASTASTAYRSWHDCPRLVPRGKCPPFRFQGWNDPRPQSASYYDPTLPSSSSSLQQQQQQHAPLDIRVLTAYGVGKVQAMEYEQPQCHGLTMPCFDMQRCVSANGNNNKTVLRVYAYPGTAERDLKALMTSSHDHEWLQVTQDPNDACILILHADDLRQQFTDMVSSSSTWNGGRNHYVYGVTKPFERNVHFGMAAVGSVALTRAQLRMGYDIPLPLPALWKANSGASIETIYNDVHRPRRWLVSFKGSIQDTLQPYYQHRWLAAEYWHNHNADDVAIDVQCKHKGFLGDLVTFAPYDNPSSQHFADLMVNSTFAFCPGGSHVTSYRLTEVLSTGSIPVLLPEIVPPFVPELDWSGCVIWISQARVVDLPRLLRAIPSDRVRARQRECQRLYRHFLANPEKDGNRLQQQLSSNSSSKGFLSMALEVWKVRVEKQHAENKLFENHFGRGH